MKSLSNIIFISCKFFTCKMEEGDDLFNHINKVKGSRINSLVWRYPERQKYCYDLARELSGVIQIFDHRHGDDVDERTYDGLRNGVFDA